VINRNKWFQIQYFIKHWKNKIIGKSTRKDRFASKLFTSNQEKGIIYKG